MWSAYKYNALSVIKYALKIQLRVILGEQNSFLADKAAKAISNKD